MGSDSCVSSCFAKVVMGTFAVMALILVMLATTEDLMTVNQVQERRIGSSSSKTSRTTSSASATSDQFVETSMNPVDHEKLVHPEMNINYMSKRRVPKGPNPIHNRRRGNSGRPPGQA